jgi:hypothetical protein
MNDMIAELPDSTFLKRLASIINARMVSASPLRVDFLTSDLETKPESNQEAADVLSKEKHTVLHHFDEGDLNLYSDAIVLLTNNKKFPIKFFCGWKRILFSKNPAVQTKQIWCDRAYRHLRINGTPLGGYCLFNVLLPKYKIVVGSDEHSPDGERAAKQHVRYALKQGIYVYVKDEHNKFYDLTSHEIIEQDAALFWGAKPEYKERLFIFSVENLFPENS